MKKPPTKMSFRITSFLVNKNYTHSLYTVSGKRQFQMLTKQGG